MKKTLHGGWVSTKTVTGTGYSASSPQAKSVWPLKLTHPLLFLAVIESLPPCGWPPGFALKLQRQATIGKELSACWCPTSTDPTKNCLCCCKAVWQDSKLSSMEEAQALLLKNFAEKLWVGKGNPSACAQWLTEMARDQLALQSFSFANSGPLIATCLFQLLTAGSTPQHCPQAAGFALPWAQPPGKIMDTLSRWPPACAGSDLADQLKKFHVGMSTSLDACSLRCINFV